MAPIRRYLRISRHSVLECRIYLEDPADQRWLLDTKDSVLPRVFESIRPLVLPKLREENERARAKKKSKPVKDVLVEDDFEISIFLREAGRRHSIIKRHKNFVNGPKLSSNSQKLTGTADDNSGRDVGTAMRIEDSEDEGEDVINIEDIPEAAADGPGDGDEPPSIQQPLAPDEKKLAFTTRYQGFAIWGWILCLLITRKDQSKSKATKDSNQALMEEWICTQIPQEDPEN